MSLSKMIENPDGRVFLHSLGAGAVLMVVERDGVNTSIMLSPSDALAMGRILFIDMGAERMAARVQEHLDEAEAEGSYKPLPPLALSAAPNPYAKKPPKFLVDVARYFMADEAKEYQSPTKRELHRSGRVAYVMDKMGVSYNTARNAVDRARQKGHIPRDFNTGFGRPRKDQTNGRVDVGARI